MVYAIIRYTSLGSTYNTFRNPALKIQSSSDASSSKSIPITPVTSKQHLPTQLNGDSRTSHHQVELDVPTLPDDLEMLITDSEEICLGEPGNGSTCSGKSCRTDDDECDSSNTDTPIAGGSGEMYRPAYELKDGSLERAGRASSSAVPRRDDGVRSLPG